MDITKLVHAKRQCNFFAWIGYIIGSFLIVFALAIPALFIIVIGFFIACFSMTKGSRLGAILHSALIGLLPVLLLLDTPESSPFFSLTQKIAILLLIVFIISLLGVRAAFTYHKLLPHRLCTENMPGADKQIAQTFAFFYSGKLQNIALSYFWAVVCLLPVVAPMIIWAVTDVERFYDMFDGSDVTFWLILIVYALLVGPCVSGAYYFHTRAKRVAAASLKEVKERDKRRPVLLLRSFQDDLTAIDRRLPFTTYQPTSFYTRAWTLEEVVEKTLNDYGPVIAIGRPGEKLPPAGAAREYVANEEWQGRVKDFLSEALLVVVIAGKTSGLAWEYQQLARSNLWAKLVILFPPVGEAELLERWSRFVKTVGGKSDYLLQNDASKALLAIFDENGTPTFVTSKWRDDEECYRLAIHCGLAVLPGEQAVQ